MSAANRFRRLLAYRGTAVAVALVLIGVAAFGGAWTVAQNPPTDVVSQERYRQSISTSVEDSAVVTGNTSLYPNGTRLQNMPVYFLQVSPVLNLTVQTNVPEDVPTNVSQRLVIRHRATRGGRTFWEDRRVLATADRRVTDGRMAMTVHINVSKLQDRISERRAVIGGVGSFATRFRLNVSYRTNRYSGQLTASTAPVISDRAYWLSGSLSASRSHSTTVTRRVTRAPDPFLVYGLGGLGVVSIVAAATIAILRYRGLDPGEIETDLAHARYEEWISEGEFPTGTDRKYIRINTLEDLVDVAIDSNKRVVYDEDFDAYAVIDGDLVYYFSTDPTRLDSWLDV